MSKWIKKAEYGSEDKKKTEDVKNAIRALCNLLDDGEGEVQSDAELEQLFFDLQERLR